MDRLQELLNKYDAEKESIPSPDQTPSILVIDDDESMRRGLERALSHKYSVELADSGQVGVSKLNGNISCVILDIKMSGMNGFTTYSRLKEKHPDIPIIFFTAFQSEYDLQQVINTYKPEGYVEKGRDIDFLEHLIDNAVSKYRIILENNEYKVNLEKRVDEKTIQYRQQKEKAEEALEKLEKIQEEIIELKTRKRRDKFLRASAHEIKNKISPIYDYNRIIKTYVDFLPALQKKIESIIELLIKDSGKELNQKILETDYLPILNDIYEFFENNLPDKAIRSTNGIQESLEFAFQRIEIIGKEAKRRDPNFGYIQGKDRVDLKSILFQLKSEFDQYIKANSIEFTINIDKELYLFGDLTHFHDIFSNIIDNGLRHIIKAAESDPQKERILVCDVKDKNETIEIVFTDSGTGMTKEEKEGKIFDPFYTTNVGAQGEEIGWGTGMGIVRDYVELYSGTISIPFSELGKGTSISIQIPKPELKD